MKIVIFSATSFELAPILEKLGQNEHTKQFTLNNHEVELLVTGVGMTSTAFSLGQKLALNHYDLALNVGVAGAFDRSLQLGQVVNVVTDCNAEEGAEDGESFIPITALGLREENEFPFEKGYLKATYPEMIKNALPYKEVNGITVNKVHGRESSIREAQSLFHPQTESMEGAAFLYACLSNKLACIQLRAISNYVERRDRDKWELDLALNNLAEEMRTLLEKIP